MLRSALALLATIPFLASCSRSDSSGLASYAPPTLDGWEKDEPGANNDDGHSVTYRKKVGHTKIRMKFTVLAPAEGEKPDDLAALKEFSGRGLADAHKMSPGMQVIEQSETTFRTFPALLTRTHDKYRGADRERKVLRVADGKNTFLFDQTLTGKPVDPAAQTEADAAWSKISSGLQLP